MTDTGHHLSPPWSTRRAPFSEALVQLGSDRPDVMVITGDLANWTDVLPFSQRYPDRFVNVGMAEQNLVGVGAGMARAGAFPVMVTYGVFATRRAYDQVAMGLCTGGVNSLLVGFLPGITSQFKATHQAIDDVALMRALPGMTILDPADATELKAMVSAAPEIGGPVYLRASRGDVPVVFDGVDDIRRARVVRHGSDVAYVTTGIACRWALEAAVLLAAQHIEATVLHVPMLKPFDTAAVVALASHFDTLHCVENHSTIGGLTAAVCSATAAHGLGVRVVGHGIDDRWAEYGRLDYNRVAFGLDAAALAGAVR